MDQHVKILGWLHIVYGAFFLGVMVLVGGGLGLGGMFADDPNAALALPIVGTGLVFLGVVLGLPGIVTGWGLLKHRNWARILTIILSILNLPAFPIGTALGAYGLWVMFNEQTVAMFRQPRTY